MMRRPLVSLRTSLIASGFLAAYIVACFLIVGSATEKRPSTIADLNR